jgi:hypothetical protein
MDSNTITAIAGLWKLAAVLLISFVIIHWRKNWPGLFIGLYDFFRGLYFRGKWGQAEAEIRRLPDDKSPTTIEIQPTIPPPLAPVEDTKPKAPTEKEVAPGEVNNFAEMFLAFEDRNEALAVEYYKKLQDAAIDSTEKLKDEVFYFYLRFRYLADPKALTQLEKLSEVPDVKYDAHYWAGIAYQKTDVTKASMHFEEAASAAKSDADRAKAVIDSARSIYAVDRKRAFSRIIEQIARTQNPGELKLYFLGLGSLYRESENHSLRAVTLEKALEIVPNDTNTIFEAAYSYSKNGFCVISTRHYKDLVQFLPDSPGAWNNLGVAYDRLKLPILAVNSYRKSVELKNTLAAANLAYEYINAGFAEEASRVLNEARTKEDVHPNVGRALADVADKKEQEHKDESGILENGRVEQRFLRAFGAAYFQLDDNCPSFNGKWQSDNSIELAIEQKENDLTGTWILKQRFLAPTEKTYSFSGDANNRGAIISLHEDGRTSLTSSVIGKGYAYLSPNGQELFTLTMKDTKHTMLEFRRIS